MRILFIMLLFQSLSASESMLPSKWRWVVGGAAIASGVALYMYNKKSVAVVKSFSGNNSQSSEKKAVCTFCEVIRTGSFVSNNPTAAKIKKVIEFDHNGETFILAHYRPRGIPFDDVEYGHSMVFSRNHRKKSENDNTMGAAASLRQQSKVPIVLNGDPEHVFVTMEAEVSQL